MSSRHFYSSDLRMSLGNTRSQRTEVVLSEKKMMSERGMRGRSPGRVSARRSSSARMRTLSAEPPRDLRELRRECPNIRWGGNVPMRNDEVGMMPEHDYRPAAANAGLPDAYVMATRGGYTPTADHSYIRSSSRGRAPTTPRASRLSSLAPRSPWKGSGLSTQSHSGHSGVFSAPRSVESGVYGRPGGARSAKSPSASSRIYAPPAQHTRRAFTSGGTTTATRSVVPGFGGFKTNATPVSKGRNNTQIPRSERSTYSRGSRRRTPSPRPTVAQRRERDDEQEGPSVTAGNHTEKLMRALAGRADFERELHETCVDPTQQIAPDLDEYLQEVHHPVNYGATSYLAEEAVEVPQEVSQEEPSEAGPDYFPPVQGEYLAYSEAVPKGASADEDELPEDDEDTAPISARPNNSSYYGEEVEEEEEGTPLHWAAKRGEVSMVQALLAKGADVRSILPNGKTALEVACDSLEEAALCGDEIEHLREVIRILEKSVVAAQSAPQKDNAVAKEEELGVGIYRQILRTLPRQSWDCIVDFLPAGQLHKVSQCCKGLQTLAHPRLLKMGQGTLGSASSDTEDLAIAMFNLQTFGQRRLADTVSTEQIPAPGALRVFQCLCILLGNQWVELRDVWSVSRYLLNSGNSLVSLAELARDPACLTWEQSTWIISVFSEHANDMATACDELLGAVMTLIVSLMICHRNHVSQLPLLNLPDGYLAPARRPNNALNSVTTLKTI